VPDGVLTPRGINGDGSVMVLDQQTTAGGISLLWQPGKVEQLALPGDESHTALGLSANGEGIIGEFDVLGSQHSFYWSRPTGGIDLGALPTSSESYPRAISADARVVVGHTLGTFRPYRWTLASGMQPLDLPENTNWGAAYDVNANGSLIVGTAAQGPEGIPQIVLWTQAVPEVLGSLTGASVALPPVISADGTVIAGWSGESFLWTRSSGLRLLRDVLAELGVNLTDWELEVLDVSADGKTLMGMGTHQGEQQGWIAWL